MKAAASLHLGRSVGIAGCSTLISVLTHASTDVVGPVDLLLPFFLSLAACLMLAGTKLTILRIIAATGLSQLIFHMFSMVSPHDVSGGALHASPHPLSVGHALAAALTIVVILGGRGLIEQARALAHLLFGWLVATPESALPPGYAAARSLRDNPSKAIVSVLITTVSRRGPPVGFASLSL